MHPGFKKYIQVHQIIEIGQLLWTILHQNRKAFLKWNQNWKIILVKIGQSRHPDWTFMVEIYYHLYYDIIIAREYPLAVPWNITYSRYVRDIGGQTPEYDTWFSTQIHFSVPFGFELAQIIKVWYVPPLNDKTILNFF